MSTVQFAGFSRTNGSLKFRTANDTRRINQLRKLGDTDVVILELPEEMSKNDAAKFVLNNLNLGYMVDIAEATKLLTGVISNEKTAKTVTVKKTSKIKVSKRAAEADDVKLTPKQAARVRDEWNAQHAHLSYTAKLIGKVTG
jgi:hypothetical protein